MKASWIMTLGVIVIALCVPLVLSLIYDEVEDVPQGGLDYWLGVPEDIKRVPVISACTLPLYTSRNAQGDMPPFSSVSFGSDRSAAHLADVLRGHFVAEGCAEGPTTVAPDALSCANGSEVAITVTPPEEPEAEPEASETPSDGNDDDLPTCIPVTVSIFNVAEG